MWGNKRWWHSGYAKLNIFTLIKSIYIYIFSAFLGFDSIWIDKILTTIGTDFITVNSTGSNNSCYKIQSCSFK